MRKAFQVALLFTCAVLILSTIGCGDGIHLTSSNGFLSLRYSGSPTPTISASARHLSKDTRRAMKTAQAQLSPNAVAIDPGDVNIYYWSDAVAGNERLVTSGNSASFVSAKLSADGSKAVFSAYVDGVVQIFVASVSSQSVGEPVQLTSDDVYHGVPDISSDGSKVVYTTPGATGDLLCTISSSGGSENCLNIPEFAYFSLWHPTFTPDGKIVVEAWGKNPTYPAGVDEIFVLNADGTNISKLTSNGYYADYDEAPSVSADGKFVTVARYGEMGQIWKINVATGEKTQLTNDDTKSCSDPLFVGDKIVYVSSDGRTSELWVMNSDGSNQTKITGTTDDYFYRDGYYY